MRILLFVFIFSVLFSCTTVQPKNLKSPCVAGPSDGSPTPCVKRNVNDNWLG